MDILRSHIKIPKYRDKTFRHHVAFAATTKFETSEFTPIYHSVTVQHMANELVKSSSLSQVADAFSMHLKQMTYSPRT